MYNLILFGPPGSGKGTQAAKLKEKYGLTHISTGDLFRHELKNNTELGQRIRQYIDNGKLVPDEITITMLKNKINSLPEGQGFLLDGFPRNIFQAQALDKLMEELGANIDLLVSLEVPEEEIVKRILNRGKTSGRSDDNDEEIIRERFHVYQDQTLPVFEYYAKQGKAKSIDGLGSIEEIFNRIVCVVDENLK